MGARGLATRSGYGRRPYRPPPGLSYDAGMAIDVNEADFEREVIQASHQQPVVVDFWAEWCGPCKQLAPILEAAVARRQGAVKLVKVDTDKNQQLAMAFRIQGIPAVKAFRDGQLVNEFTGVLPPPQIEQFLDSLVPSAAEEAVAAGDEGSLRALLAEDDQNVDAAVALSHILLARGDAADAIAVLTPVKHHAHADGLLACAEVLLDPALAPEISGALERLAGDPEGALQAMIDLLPGATDARKDLVRRVMVGIFAQRPVDDPIVITYRKRLASALY